MKEGKKSYSGNHQEWEGRRALDSLQIQRIPAFESCCHPGEEQAVLLLNGGKGVLESPHPYHHHQRRPNQAQPNQQAGCSDVVTAVGGVSHLPPPPPPPPSQGGEAAAKPQAAKERGGKGNNIAASLGLVVG